MIQRVRSGRVTVADAEVGAIEHGYVVLLGVRDGDTEDNARYLADKTVNLRIFSDEDGRMNRSLDDVHGAVLVVSQFTLYADTRKGNRPSFIQAGAPELAEALYEVYVAALRRALGAARVATGQFRATMLVEIHNDGPVTVELTTDPLND